MLPSFVALRPMGAYMSWSGTPRPLVFSQRHKETTAGWRILRLVRLGEMLFFFVKENYCKMKNRLKNI